LIDANKGDQLWADSFTDDLAELMKLQDDIVDRLARPLQIELVHAETRRSLREGHITRTQ
jgi:adenylate cyclase